MYLWLYKLVSFLFCITVKYIFPFLNGNSKYKKSCQKQPKLAPKHKLCFHNVFCPTKQLVVMHFKFYWEYFVGEYLALAKDIIPLQQCGVQRLIKQELPGVTIWKLIALMYWQHWPLTTESFSCSAVQLKRNTAISFSWKYVKMLFWKETPDTASLLVKLVSLHLSKVPL